MHTEHTGTCSLRAKEHHFQVCFVEHCQFGQTSVTSKRSGQGKIQHAYTKLKQVQVFLNSVSYSIWVHSVMPMDKRSIDSRCVAQGFLGACSPLIVFQGWWVFLFVNRKEPPESARPLTVGLYPCHLHICWCEFWVWVFDRQSRFVKISTDKFNSKRLFVWFPCFHWVWRSLPVSRFLVFHKVHVVLFRKPHFISGNPSPEPELTSLSTSETFGQIQLVRRELEWNRTSWRWRVQLPCVHESSESAGKPVYQDPVIVRGSGCAIAGHHQAAALNEWRKDVTCDIFDDSQLSETKALVPKHWDCVGWF